MSNPLISCVVPTFNSERYLGEAIASVLAQTYSPLEIIVSDDGSTDGTLRVAARWGDAVRVVSQCNGGPAATRNLGIKASCGELVAFLDADDLWHQDKLSRQMERFRARHDLDLCACCVEMFWSDELSRERLQYGDHPRAGGVPGYATTTLLAKRSAFDVVGMFDVDLWFGDAADWFIRAAECGASMELLPDVLVYHRMHRSNLTRRNVAASREEFLSILKASLDRRRARGGGAAKPYPFSSSRPPGASAAPDRREID